MSVTFISHKQDVLDAVQKAIDRGLEICGGMAEGYAKRLCPVDTGRLRNSITHQQYDEKTEGEIGDDVRDYRGHEPKALREEAVDDARHSADVPAFAMLYSEQGDHPPEAREVDEPLSEEQLLRDGNDKRARGELSEHKRPAADLW